MVNNQQFIHWLICAVFVTKAIPVRNLKPYRFVTKAIPVRNQKLYTMAFLAIDTYLKLQFSNYQLREKPENCNRFIHKFKIQWYIPGSDSYSGVLASGSRCGGICCRLRTRSLACDTSCIPKQNDPRLRLPFHTGSLASCTTFRTLPCIQYTEQHPQIYKEVDGTAIPTSGTHINSIYRTCRTSIYPSPTKPRLLHATHMGREHSVATIYLVSLHEGC